MRKTKQNKVYIELCRKVETAIPECKSTEHPFDDKHYKKSAVIVRRTLKKEVKMLSIKESNSLIKYLMLYGDHGGWLYKG